MKSKKFLSGFAAAAAIALFTPIAQANNPGDIFTAHSNGSECVKAAPAHFETKPEVYLIGKNLPEGNYYIKVTDPSGTPLLGTSVEPVPATVHVGADGDFPCTQLTAILFDGSQLGFLDTKNPGGVYKVWISTDSTFAGGTEKTHNFKVSPSCPDCDPRITCPGNISQPCEGAGGALVTYNAPTVTGGATPYETVCSPASGSIFPTGQTTVTCTVTDADLIEDSCSFKVTVTGQDCAEKCHLTSCPDVVQCNDLGRCDAVVNYLRPIACNVVCDHPPGSTFPVGSTTVICTSTDNTIRAPNTSTCTFHVVVNDCEDPKITCPANITDCLNSVNGNVEAVGTATASDNCPGVTVAGVRSDGKALSAAYPCGVTTIHWTATDGALRTATCDQTVTITGAKVYANKFYDANANGSNDDGKVVSGVKITLSGTDSKGNAVSVVKYTVANGTVSFTCVPLGTYTVSETAPSSNWKATTPTSVPLSVTDCAGNYSASFGNVCLGAGGALSKGFWGNSNGQKEFKSNCGGFSESLNCAFLGTLNFRNATGAKPDISTYSKFGTWLGNATAVNMAYMLSAQLAAMELNVRLAGNSPCAGPYGDTVGAGALIYAPGTGSANAAGFASINAIMAEANIELGLHGMTTASGTIRNYQEGLKNALDNACNNLNFVQASPCTISSPY